MVLTLALGIGANAAIFTLFDQVLLRMLPVREAEGTGALSLERRVHGSLSSVLAATAGLLFSYPMYKDLREQNQVFTGHAGGGADERWVQWHNQAESHDAEIVSGNYFQLLGLKPAVGRLFTAQDETAKNANAVVVLSYDYWRTHFAGVAESDRADDSDQWASVHHCGCCAGAF